MFADKISAVDATKSTGIKVTWETQHDTILHVTHDRSSSTLATLTSCTRAMGHWGILPWTGPSIPG